MAQFNYATTASNLFKIKYGKISDVTYNSANVLQARIKKEYNFVGKRMDVAVPVSFSGGVGSGSLPTPNASATEDAQITAKKVYATIQVDRETLKAAETDEGAFVRMTKYPTQKGIESAMRNFSRILFNDGTGILGQFSGNAGGTATVSTVTILTTGTYGYRSAHFEEKDYVNVNTLASVWEITSVVEGSGTAVVTLTRISGSDDLTAIGAGTHSIYMQNSRDSDPQGLLGVLNATGGNLYSVAVQRRWKAFQLAAGGGGITTDLLNQLIIGVEKQCGKTPNMLVTSPVQYRKIQNQIEDLKQYIIEPRITELKGKVSFKALEFMSSAGAIPIVWDRFCKDDYMYGLNDNFVIAHHRPGSPGWADDDGTVFLRDSDSDSYSARYCNYYENYIPPSFHGVLSGLAV